MVDNNQFTALSANSQYFTNFLSVMMTRDVGGVPLISEASIKALQILARRFLFIEEDGDMKPVISKLSCMKNFFLGSSSASLFILLSMLYASATSPSPSPMTKIWLITGKSSTKLSQLECGNDLWL